MNPFKYLIKILGRKEIILPVALLALSLLIIPVPTFAFWERIVAAVTALPVLIIALLLVVVIAVSGFFVMLMSALLEWIISPNFISLSYTRPCPAPYSPPPATDLNCNPIIGLGLDTTQQFVNMLLVIILVYIALSIALRAGDGKAEKLFPKLIIVALLVNFAPVFIGLIVDAANIIMNYFLAPLQGGFGQIGSQLSAFWDVIMKNLGKVFSDLPSQVGLLGQAMMMIIMNIIVGMTLFMFAGIFLVRYVAIWVIVILSPLAFVFWILPGTQGLYKMWEKQLVQWSFIGIPIAFFMYLGVSSLAVLTQAFNAASIQPSAPGIDPQATNLLSQLFPYFVVIIFLIIGLFVGLSTSAMGAKAVLSGTKKIGEWAGKKGISKGRHLGSDIGNAFKDTAGKVGFYKKQYENARTSGKSWGAATKEAATKTWSKKTSIGQKTETVMASEQAKTRIEDLKAGAMTHDDAEKKVEGETMASIDARTKISDLMTEGMSYGDAEERVKKEMMRSAEVKTRIRDLKSKALSEDEAKKQVGKWAFRQGFKQDAAERGGRALKVARDHSKAAGAGVGGALLDMTVMGWDKTFGTKTKKKKKKKKGKQKCPECDEEIAKSAKTCPYCGYDLEEFEPEKPEKT